MSLPGDVVDASTHHFDSSHPRAAPRFPPANPPRPYGRAAIARMPEARPIRPAPTNTANHAQRETNNDNNNNDNNNDNNNNNN